MKYKILITLLWANILPLAAQDESLRELAESRGLYIGAAISDNFWNEQSGDKDIYRETIEREFNITVHRNKFKFSRIQPTRGTFNWQPADDIVDFAEANNMKMRGHTLVWHSSAGWAADVNGSREEMIELMKTHIFAVVGRYKGRISHWDVVNEAIDKEGEGLRETFWQQTIGNDYIDLAFKFAHEADPDALLYYNEYHTEGMSKKSDYQYEMVKGMLDRGIPVHGVGLQGHFILGEYSEGIMENFDWEGHPMKSWYIDTVDIAENMKRLSDLGLKVAFTELDIRIPLPASQDELQMQKRYYNAILDLCLKNPNCDTFVLWGFTDKISWIPGKFEGTGDALIFDKDYKPKPAYHGLWDALNEATVGVHQPAMPGSR